MGRTQAREDCFKMLFEAKVAGTSADELLEKFDVTFGDKDLWEQKDKIAEKDVKYMNELLRGVEENEGRLNGLIAPFLKRWTVARLAKVDLALLQMAVYEALFMDDIPAAVAVNEAVELAKKYGGEDAPAFINGVLHSVIKENG